MKIRFETTLDDFLAFVRYHHAHSPATRAQLTRTMATVPTVLGLILLLQAWSQHPRLDEALLANLPFYLVVFVVVSVPWAVFMYFYFPWTIERNTRKLLAEGTNRVLIGWREMDLVDGRLVLKSELVDTRLDLRAIQKIVTTDRYTFIYIGSVSAYIIPMDLYPEDDYRDFVADLRAAWENRDAPRASPESRSTDVRITERPH